MGLDPNYLYDNSDVIWYGTEGYNNALGALMKVSGKSELAVEMNLNAKYGAADYWTAMQALEDQGVVIARNSNGYRCFAYQDSVMTTSPTGPMYATDSNATSTTLVNAAPVYDTVVDDVAGSATEGKVLVNPVGSVLDPSHGFYGWKFFAGECVQAVGAASVGITLGKAFDSAVYNAFPDFFDANGMSSLNPETWNSITNGDDSFAAGLFNMVFGLDPNTGKGQAFIDEETFAYLAYWMAQNEVFSTVQKYDVVDNIDGLPTGLTNVTFQKGNWNTVRLEVGWRDHYENVSGYVFNSMTGDYIIYSCSQSGSLSNKAPFLCMVQYVYNEITYTIFAYENGYNIYSGTPWLYYNTRSSNPRYDNTYSVLSNLHSNEYTKNYDDKTAKYFSTTSFPSTLYQRIPESTVTDTPNIANIAWSSVFGTSTHHEESAIPGVSSQPNSTLPDTTSWESPQDTLPSLQSQYPSLWDNSVPNTIVQPDGSTKTITYVPIALPQVNGQWDTQPTSNPDSTQVSPQVTPQTEPTTETNDLIKTLIQLITMPQPQPDPDTQTQPQEQPQPNIPTPPITGEGDSPTPVAPTGNASALWSVYHPTQAQVNSFGAWLWGSPFLTNIGKLFTNPIDGVISLHKIFATPVDSGTGTIVVGTLDSGVSSATVNQQYVYVDCGSVSCSEYFGTVFDYPPHTNISLYLPFIGIVPLDTNDVMRSTISVTYGVDVYTGACLAMVEITRDGGTVNMYQYAGVASVEYPLSNVQNGQLVSGLLAIGAGVASMIATGGITAPAAGAVVAGVATSAKSSVSKSGGFSGNSGAMGIKTPYLIIQRPQIKTADTFPRLAGYPTNYSCKLGDCSNHVVVKHVHVEGIPATDTELEQIESLLKEGVLI